MTATWIAISFLFLWCTALTYLVCFRIRDGQTDFIDPIRRRLWGDRHPDQVEWSADAIVKAVTGRSLGYCGRCMLQCFSGGKPRPAGLR